MANPKAIDSAPAAKQTPPRRSPRLSSAIAPAVTVSQATEPYASPSDAAKSGSGQRRARRSRGSFGTPTRGKKQRPPSPSSPPASLTSPLPPSPPPSSPPSPQKTCRSLFPRVPSPPRGSKSAPIEIPPDESEQEQDDPTTQTTPNPSPAPKEKHLDTSSKKPHLARSIYKSRTVRAPATLTSTSGGGGGGSDTGRRRAQSIDGNIENQIRNPSRPSKRDKELGFVYVVPAEHILGGKALVKIGFTAGASVDTRRQNIIGAHCKATVRLLPPSPSSPDDARVRLFYEQVEKLAHLELRNFRYEFSCGCCTQHREFFDVDEAVARRVVDRWKRFCALGPFNTRDGTLTDEWRFHLDRFGERNHGRPGPGGQLEEADDHDGRHRRWESFLAYKHQRSDWLVHRAGMLRSKLWTNRWQLWSLGLAFLFVGSMLSWSSLVLLVATASGICGEESTRDTVVDLASLLWDVAAHSYLKTTTSAADEVEGVEEVQEVQETNGGERELNIRDDSETGDGEQGTKREEGEGLEDEEEVDEEEEDEEEEDEEEEEEEDEEEDEEDEDEEDEEYGGRRGARKMRRKT